MQKYFDKVQLRTGQAIEGAVLRVYLAGTSTLATLYEDDETTEIIQPLVTDADGEYSFKADDGDYDITLTPGTLYVGKTVTEVHLEDYKTVASSDLAASSGSSLVGFIQSGTGAVARTVQEKGREIVSITDFANDDGTAVSAAVADNSTGLQKAFDDGRALYIPDGEFTYATGLTLPRTNSTMLYGCGAFRSILKYTGSGKAVSWKIDVIDTVSFAHLQGFQIDCSDSTATHGLDLSSKSDGNGHRWSTYKDLYIVGANVASSTGFNMLSGRYITLENVVSRDWDTDFDFNTNNSIPCSNITAIDCLASGGITYGWRTRATCIGFTWLRCAAEGDGLAYGWHLVGPSSTKPDSHSLRDCWTEDDHTVNFYFENLRGILMDGCTVGTDTTGDGISLVNVRASKFSDLRMEEYDAGKYAITADSNSVWNHFQGFIRDSRNLSAVNIVSVRNTYQFNFASNATSPLVLTNGPAKKFFTNTGATIDTRENGVYLVDTSGGNVTLPATSVTAQNQGVVLEIKKTTADANTVQFDPASSTTVDGAANFILRYPNECLTVIADGSIPGWRVLAHYVPPLPPIIVTTAVGNVGSGTDVLQSSNVAASTLLAAGDGWHSLQQGTIASNTNPKTIAAQVGGVDVVSQALTVSIASTWRIEVDVISTGTDTQDYYGVISYEAPAGTWVHRPFNGTLTADDGAVIAVRTNGTVTDGGGGINNNDIVQEYQKIEFIRRTT